jgi:hypothetical protein
MNAIPNDAQCRHCGEGIVLEQGQWATTDPLRDGPWYCAASDKLRDARHEPVTLPDDHECPKQQFLDDPITRAYGVGGEMVSSIACAVCDAREADEL